jgi:hypothetical protein
MLIGLTGYSRAGKDTVAEILTRNHGFEKRNLASPIRNILLPVFDSIRPEISELVRDGGWDEVKAVFPESVDAMIALGQGGRDFVGIDVWLNACTGQPYENLVIADVRQPNEYEYISEHGGQVWNIRSERAQKRGMDGILDDFYFEYTIDNDGTIAELEAYIGEIMGEGDYLE